MNSSLPRVLVVSDSCISPAHGTGTVLLRHFAAYPPERLANAFFNGSAPAWDHAFPFQVRPAARRGVAAGASWLARIYSSLMWRAGLRQLFYNRPLEVQPLSSRRIGQDFVPEVVYSVVYSPVGLALVDGLLADLPTSIPVIQYFMDYEDPVGFRRHRYLRRVLARAEEVWALTEEIAGKIAGEAQAVGKSVRVQPAFHLDLPRQWKQSHRVCRSADVRCVISGNFWKPDMAKVVKRAWGQVQKALPGLGPIVWYCHPESAQRVREVVGELGPEIQPAGFFSGQALLDRLIEADLTVVPFNAARRPESDYARFSLPSRLTEILSVGLPVFCIAGEETPVGRYLSRHQLGIVCDAEDERRLAERLTTFVSDRDARAALGLRARQFAEREFPIGPFRNFLYAKLSALASRSKTQGRIGHFESKPAEDVRS